MIFHKNVFSTNKKFFFLWKVTGSEIWASIQEEMLLIRSHGLTGHVLKYSGSLATTFYCCTPHWKKDNYVSETPLVGWQMKLGSKSKQEKNGYGNDFFLCICFLNNANFGTTRNFSTHDSSLGKDNSFLKNLFSFWGKQFHVPSFWIF